MVKDMVHDIYDLANCEHWTTLQLLRRIKNYIKIIKRTTEERNEARKEEGRVHAVSSNYSVSG